MDAWADLSTYVCATCRFYVPKEDDKGRCRRHAPTMDGYPVVYEHDWCGDHKLGTNPSRQKLGPDEARAAVWATTNERFGAQR